MYLQQWLAGLSLFAFYGEGLVVFLKLLDYITQVKEIEFSKSHL